MKKRFQLVFGLTLMLAGQMNAQEENLKMHFDFTDVSGVEVKDNVSGITAKLKNEAEVKSLGNYNVLDLGNGTGYLDMTNQAGAIVKKLTDFTVSVCYRVDEEASLSGAGYFLWCFSQSAANTQTAAPYTAYRLNAQRMATSTGGWGNESGMEIGSASETGVWKHMLYRQTSQTGELYIDGKRMKTLATMPVLGQTFTAVPAYCWIGRAPFATDNYLKQTLVADFRLYDVAVTDETVATLAAMTTALEEAYTNGGGGDNTSLLAAIVEAEALLTDVENYPVGAVTMLQDAVSVARSVASVEKNQLVYDNQETELRSIMATYAGAKGFVFAVSGLSDAYDTERGFRHPGGLHTQADFDRIKRQLAEGNATVTAAYNILKNAEYAQSGVQTWPVETIVRGGSGQNYINAARGATMAYQNALRWKIEGTKANAEAAVRILMAWANTCKLVSGDSNWALAAGLYGYQFAQAAELMRDYEGWSREDFNAFKQWMLTVWYPGNINFLRGRNGTWENWVGSQGGIRPGHYWSNWPLCNALAVISIGILCDDVFIYNQGISFMKYDQVGTFQNPRTADPILSDGCTEFIGNLIVTTSESALETGAYGRLGQMQESGRDGGHAAMALGLAVDICKVAWNQGDDLFSYMDNRMAAGVEFVAACTQNVQGLPWTNYKYVDCRTAWHNGWLMTGPAEPAEVRNYWGTVIGHYEGVKGVKMPFAEQAYNALTAGGPDAGGTGGSSGPYDHLGYSVLMNTYDEQLCPEEKRPTLLSPSMEYDGQVLAHNELGGLRNTYVVQSTEPVPMGKTIKLMPQLPEGEENTGQWQWNTGETTQDITVSTDRSYIYRVIYTNKNGITSEQAFSIAVEGDCTSSPATYGIYANGIYVGDTVASVLYGDKLTLNVGDVSGWNPLIEWDNGAKGGQSEYGVVATDRIIQACVTSQGGRRTMVNFYINVISASPYIKTPTATVQDTECIVSAGQEVTLGLHLASSVSASSVTWSTGEQGSEITLSDVQTSGRYTASFPFGGETVEVEFQVLVKAAKESTLASGCYLVCHAETGRLLTGHTSGGLVTFEDGDISEPSPLQVWRISSMGTRHSLIAMPDSLPLFPNGNLGTVNMYSFYFEQAVGSYRCAIRTGFTESSKRYWDMNADGSVNIELAASSGFPFLLIPVDPSLGIEETTILPQPESESGIYDLQGRRIDGLSAKKGIYIINGKKVIRP